LLAGAAGQSAPAPRVPIADGAVPRAVTLVAGLELEQGRARLAAVLGLLIHLSGVRLATTIARPGASAPFRPAVDRAVLRAVVFVA